MVRMHWADPRTTREFAVGGKSVSYFSLLPFPGVGGAGEFPTYLSSNAAGGWSTQGLLPPSNPPSLAGVAALTEDLDYAIVEVGPAGPLLGEAPSIEGEEGTVEKATLGESYAYIRSNVSGEYRLLAPDGRAHFADSSRDDSTILFEDRHKLTEKATSFLNSEDKEEPEAGTNLYEWKNGVVKLAGLVPPAGDRSCGLSGPACEAPADGAVAGPGGPAIAETEFGLVASAELPGGATSGFGFSLAGCNL